MTQVFSTMLLFMMLNLSPYGPAELREGAYWKYRLGGGAEATMRISEVSPGGSGMSLRMELTVSQGGETQAIPLRALLAADRRSVRTWRDVPSGAQQEYQMPLPEFRRGLTWEVPDADALTVDEVADHQRTSTPAGDFADALKVSGRNATGDAGEMWVARGVGLLWLGQGGKREIELVDHGPRLAAGAPSRPPGGLPALPMAGPPAPRPAPVVTVLDKDTFLVTDPVTRTVTLFLLTRKDDKWTLVKKAVAPYGTPMPAKPPATAPATGGDRPWWR
jgi:hypothetical protein